MTYPGGVIMTPLRRKYGVLPLRLARVKTVLPNMSIVFT